MKAQSKVVVVEEILLAMDKVELILRNDGFTHELESKLSYILHNIDKIVQKDQNKITELS
jgi:hypothetical protein